MEGTEDTNPPSHPQNARCDIKVTSMTDSASDSEVQRKKLQNQSSDIRLRLDSQISVPTPTFRNIPRPKKWPNASFNLKCANPN